MSVVFPINADPRFRLSTAVGGETSYSVPFPFQDNDDIAVIRYAGTGDTIGTELTEGVHYTLTGTAVIGAEGFSGGTIILAVPAVTGQIYLRLGRAVVDRVTSIIRQGKFSSAAIDGDLDRWIIIAQELIRDIGRAWKAPYGQKGGVIFPGAPETTPKFDAAGNLIEGPSVDQIEGAAANAEEAKSAADRAIAVLDAAANLAENGLVIEYGAIGDGATDDSAAFAALEAVTTGGAVNLLGGTYVVAALPTGNDYYNGAFKIGADVFYRNRNPREHPLANPTIHAKAIMYTEGRYRAFHAAFQPEGTSRLIVVTREALGHAPENNIPIICGVSDDFGDRFGLSVSDGQPVKVIAQQSNADIRNWAHGTMGNGRLGIMAARRDFDGGTYLNPGFLYCDNANEATGQLTWTLSTAFTLTTASWDSHGEIYPYPASVGGHDTLGYICYGYTTSNGICAAYTTDNGPTWTQALNCVMPTSLDPASQAASISEMSVARLGKQNKWVMVIRTNQEAAVSVSTDMINWSSPKLIPAALMTKMLANPPVLTYEDGKLWFWSFSRRGSKEIYPEYANALCVAEGDPEVVFASGGAAGWKPWRVVSNLPFWPVGYMSFFKSRGRNFAIATTGEDTAGASTSRQAVLTLLGPDPTVAVGVNNLQRLVAKPNLYKGGDFRHMPLAGPFVTGASRVPIAPLMSFGRNGGAAGATITRLAGRKGPYKLRIGRDDGNASLAPPNLIIVLPREDCAQLRSRFVTVSFDAIMAAGFSAANAFLNVRMRQTNSQAEGVVTSLSGSFPVGDALVQSANSGITLSQRLQRYECVIGPFAADCEQAMLQMFWTPVGTATNDYWELENLKIEEGKIATAFEVQPLADIKTWADRFLRVFTMPTINGRQFRSLDPQMHRDPTVTLSRGTVASSTKDYVSVDDTANSVATVTAIATM